MPPVGYVVDHINNDKLDNRLSNLQLLTTEENSHKAKTDGLYKSGDDSPMTVLPVVKRAEIVIDYGTGQYAMRQLAEKYGISESRVHQIIHLRGWTDIGEWVDTKGKLHKDSSDSARYKALGNSIAIPPWTFVLERISQYTKDNPTMGSLFDGIGGFPLIWERINGEGTAVWASEIEEFPIAVTKRHFPERE